ncbi:MAG TPA: hydantoinase B/oxoprolinase family protein, partial [Acetobacteraceae bacterium]|nr:hydantoinase B/oxoprolinase family protein [Acetobacteraceae bacterium]
GGRPAKSGNVTVEKAKGGSQAMRKAKGYALEAGDLVTLETGGGGGYGDPSRRAATRIADDIADGYITA